MVVYLSPEWLARAAELAATIELADLRGSLVVDYTVTGDPAVDYHVAFEAPRARLVPGPAHDADVRFTLSRQTAAAVAAGELSAQRAVIDGDLVLSGDSSALLRHRELLDRLGDVLAELRNVTRYT